MHIRKFMFDTDKGWIPTKTGIMLLPFEIQEMAHFLPHLGHAYDFVLQRLSQKRLKTSDVGSHSVPMDMDIPKPEAMDTDAVPSLIEEFEELLFSKQCKDIIDEIHHVNRNCVMDACLIILDSWTMIFVSLIGKRKWTVASMKLLRMFHWISCWKT